MFWAAGPSVLSKLKVDDSPRFSSFSKMSVVSWVAPLSASKLAWSLPTWAAASTQLAANSLIFDAISTAPAASAIASNDLVMLST